MMIKAICYFLCGWLLSVATFNMSLPTRKCFHCALSYDFNPWSVLVGVLAALCLIKSISVIFFASDLKPVNQYDSKDLIA
ncbi:hypothetical protein [Pseudoalteromonas sp. Of7M-16]|uniref:hypothetical protein n=1 Tax=Pseudoalteromonas sp. Of7M-16 TaxID=2917756 RepID=UPI001EF6914C|nr:hypothetical protein [Pseudoalteromonas sp. Of7M-16]MCG7548221.1 hypothetical protein [Pseudoalteromonas sp. Of7M-16]